LPTKVVAEVQVPDTPVVTLVVGQLAPPDEVGEPEYVICPQTFSNPNIKIRNEKTNLLNCKFVFIW
jgi:hypothetical protein